MSVRPTHGFVYTVVFAGRTYVGASTLSSLDERLVSHASAICNAPLTRFYAAIWQHVLDTCGAMTGRLVLEHALRPNARVLQTGVPVSDLRRVEGEWVRRLNSDDPTTGWNRRRRRGPEDPRAEPYTKWDTTPRPCEQWYGECLVGMHLSVCQAARATGLSAANIRSVCRGRLLTTGGYRWRYIDAR